MTQGPKKPSYSADKCSSAIELDRSEGDIFEGASRKRARIAFIAGSQIDLDEGPQMPTNHSISTHSLFAEDSKGSDWLTGLRVPFRRLF